MATLPKPLLRYKYEKSARQYLESLPLEHFMEATPRAQQREITLASLSLVRAQRQDFHLFNELLVQYELPDNGIGKVVPDNMIVLHTGELDPISSYNLPLQPAKPFCVMEYVSKNSERKDYEDNFVKYEQHLQVPYYLLFYPEEQEMTLFHLSKKKFVSVKPNKQGRCTIRKLQLEMALHDDWVRFWYKGEMLPLPPDLLNELNTTREQLLEANRRAEQEAQRAEQEAQQRIAVEQELAQAREELERLRRQQDGESS